MCQLCFSFSDMNAICVFNSCLVCVGGKKNVKLHLYVRRSLMLEICQICTNDRKGMSGRVASHSRTPSPTNNRKRTQRFPVKICENLHRTRKGTYRKIVHFCCSSSKFARMLVSGTQILSCRWKCSTIDTRKELMAPRSLLFIQPPSSSSSSSSPPSSSSSSSSSLEVFPR